jgi:hypothetical protein
MNFQKTFFVCLFSFACATLSAQYNTMHEWYIGPTAGVTMSNINLMPKVVDKLYYNGRTAGFSTRYISENHYGFQAEVNYFEAGWKEDLYGLKKASEYTYARSLNFIEVPFLLHAYGGSKATRIFLNVGPKISYLYSDSEEVIDQTEKNNLMQHGLKIDHPFQYGLLGGVGMELHLKRSVLGLEGRYCYMLSNLFNDAVDVNNFSSSNMQMMSLNLYYYFQLKK